MTTYSCLAFLCSRYKHDVLFPQNVVGGAGSGEEPSYVDHNELFGLKVTCDMHGFYFEVVGDHEYPFYPRVVWLDPKTINRVVVKGSTGGVRFMTFVNEGLFCVLGLFSAHVNHFEQQS